MGCWSVKQEQFLKDNYGKLLKKELAFILNKTDSSIRMKAHRLGLKSDLKKSGKDTYLNWLYNSEYSLLEEFTRTSDKLLHVHNKCGKIWLVSPNNLRKLVGCPKCSKKPYSKMAIEWLNSFNNPDIIHAENGGEASIMGYKVDGYDPNTETVYEFHGDVWHGNPEVFEDTDRPHPYNNKTAKELYESTKKKSDKIKTKYKLIEMWEYTWKTHHLSATQSST